MNDILILYPSPQKVKYDYSDCNITDHLREQKARSSNKLSCCEGVLRWLLFFLQKIASQFPQKKLKIGS